MIIEQAFELNSQFQEFNIGTIHQKSKSHKILENFDTINHGGNNHFKCTDFSVCHLLDTTLYFGRVVDGRVVTINQYTLTNQIENNQLIIEIRGQYLCENGLQFYQLNNSVYILLLTQSGYLYMQNLQTNEEYWQERLVDGTFYYCLSKQSQIGRNTISCSLITSLSSIIFVTLDLNQNKLTLTNQNIQQGWNAKILGRFQQQQSYWKISFEVGSSAVLIFSLKDQFQLLCTQSGRILNLNYHKQFKCKSIDYFPICPIKIDSRDKGAMSTLIIKEGNQIEVIQLRLQIKGVNQLVDFRHCKPDQKIESASLHHITNITIPGHLTIYQIDVVLSEEYLFFTSRNQTYYCIDEHPKPVCSRSNRSTNIFEGIYIQQNGIPIVIFQETIGMYHLINSENWACSKYYQQQASVQLNNLKQQYAASTGTLLQQLGLIFDQEENNSIGYFILIHIIFEKIPISDLFEKVQSEQYQYDLNELIEGVLLEREEYLIYTKDPVVELLKKSTNEVESQLVTILRQITNMCESLIDANRQCNEQSSIVKIFFRLYEEATRCYFSDIFTLYLNSLIGLSLLNYYNQGTKINLNQFDKAFRILLSFQLIIQPNNSPNYLTTFLKRFKCPQNQFWNQNNFFNIDLNSEIEEIGSLMFYSLLDKPAILDHIHKIDRKYPFLQKLGCLLPIENERSKMEYYLNYLINQKDVQAIIGLIEEQDDPTNILGLIFDSNSQFQETKVLIALHYWQAGSNDMYFQNRLLENCIKTKNIRLSLQLFKFMTSSDSQLVDQFLYEYFCTEKIEQVGNFYFGMLFLLSLENMYINAICDKMTQHQRLQYTQEIQQLEVEPIKNRNISYLTYCNVCLSQYSFLAKRGLMSQGLVLIIQQVQHLESILQLVPTMANVIIEQQLMLLAVCIEQLTGAPEDPSGYQFTIYCQISNKLLEESNDDTIISQIVQLDQINTIYLKKQIQYYLLKQDAGLYLSKLSDLANALLYFEEYKHLLTLWTFYQDPQMNEKIQGIYSKLDEESQQKFISDLIVLPEQLHRTIVMALTISMLAHRQYEYLINFSREHKVEEQVASILLKYGMFELAAEIIKNLLERRRASSNKEYINLNIIKEVMLKCPTKQIEEVLNSIAAL